MQATFARCCAAWFEPDKGRDDRLFMTVPAIPSKIPDFSEDGWLPPQVAGRYTETGASSSRRHMGRAVSVRQLSSLIDRRNQIPPRVFHRLHSHLPEHTGFLETASN